MKVTIDSSVCKARGRCFSNEPDLFAEGEGGKGVVLVSEISDDDIDVQSQARAAAMACPMMAIDIEE